MDEPKKKKRGRKPKKVVEPIQTNDIEEPKIKVPKKRGRKPKKVDVTVEGEGEVKVPKKRGRKPKIVKKEEIIPKEEPIILHIPVKNLNKNIPTPFKFDNNFGEVDNLEDKIMLDIDVPKKNNYEELCNNYNSDIIDKDKIHPIFYEFNQSNKTKKWPSQTNIACLWCCHDFNGMPFGIPIKKMNDTFYMFGCFCSPECATAYVFNDNSSEKWDRYSLINYLYGGGGKEPIKSAPPRIALKKFGGYLSIEEFRKNNKNYNKNFNLYLPPMISTIPYLEESNIKDIKLEPSSNIMENYELKLKRTKPLPDSLNTLDNCMKLKYV